MSQGTQEHDLREARNEFELGDGSRLVLRAGVDSPILCRLEARKVDLEDAQRLDGQPFAGYRRLRD